LQHRLDFCSFISPEQIDLDLGFDAGPGFWRFGEMVSIAQGATVTLITFRTDGFRWRLARMKFADQGQLLWPVGRVIVRADDAIIEETDQFEDAGGRPGGWIGSLIAEIPRFSTVRIDYENNSDSTVTVNALFAVGGWRIPNV